MNERIRDLAYKSGLLVKNLGPVRETRGERKKTEQIQLLAELIIQECANKSLEVSLRNDDMGAIIARRIQSHFGVE